MNFHKNTIIQWDKQVPKNWATSKIKNQCQIIPSNVDKKSYDNETIVNLCNYTDVYYNNFIDNSINFMIATANEHEIGKFQLVKDDVIITKDSEDPSDIAVPAIVVETQPKLLCGYHLSILRPIHKNKYSGSFLFWALKDLSIVSQLHKEATGITRWAISNKHVKNCLLPLAPIDEQKRIATYLDKTCAAIDAAIGIKRKQLDTLEALRKSIIHKAVTQGLDDSVALKDSGVEWLGEIPAHWEQIHLKRICTKIQTGSTPPTANSEYYLDGTIPWYAPGCYNKSLYLNEPSKLINILARSDNKLRLFPVNSIFMVGIGATIGKVALTKIEASCNQQITALICTSIAHPKYVAYLLKIYEEIIPKISQYTTLPIMDQVKIGYLPVVLPPIGEQIQIGQYIDDKIFEIKKLRTNITTQISTLENYRKSLIHESVTGKRRITEADIQDG